MVCNLVYCIPNSAPKWPPGERGLLFPKWRHQVATRAIMLTKYCFQGQNHTARPKMYRSWWNLASLWTTTPALQRVGCTPSPVVCCTPNGAPSGHQGHHFSQILLSKRGKTTLIHEIHICIVLETWSTYRDSPSPSECVNCYAKGFIVPQMAPL